MMIQTGGCDFTAELYNRTDC